MKLFLLGRLFGLCYITDGICYFFASRSFRFAIWSAKLIAKERQKRFTFHTNPFEE